MFFHPYFSCVFETECKKTHSLRPRVKVTEAREVLQKALEISEVLTGKLNYVNRWLLHTEKELETLGVDAIIDRVAEMKETKKDVREALALKQEFVGLCADPSLLVGLKETLTGLESVWSRVREGLARRLPDSEKKCLHDLDLSGEDEYRFASPANTSLNSSLGEEGMLLQEFRAVFQEISSWLDSAEQKVERERRASEDRQLGEQILGLQPKVESLGAMASEIVDKCSGQRPDVEPEMVALSQRWQNIVNKMESTASFSLVQVEHIKTTIAQLVVPPPEPLTASLHSEPEEISTLPEELPVERTVRVAHIDSSRDSSPEFFSASPLTPERNGTGSKDTICTESPLRSTKKTPPPTKPKPRWYIESRQENVSEASSAGGGSVLPVQHVTVTASTLPSPRSLPSSTLPSPRSLSSSGVSSPRSLPSGNTVIEPQRKITPVPIISPVRTILPSVDTSPSTSPVNSPGSVVVAPQCVLDDIDRQNERDNAIIDRLLRGTSEDIEDVKARKSGYISSRSARDSLGNHAKEIKEFDDKFTNICLKIATARQRLEALDPDTDYALRNDLIDMELQELEAEVATTISRGDTLVLMVHRFNADQGDDLKDRVSQLRLSWANLRKNAEDKKAELAKEAETLELLKEKLEKTRPWLATSLRLVSQKKSDEERQAMARKELDRKVNEIKVIEKLVASLKSVERLGPLKEILVSVRTDWANLKDLASPVRKSKSRSPRETVDKSVPAEIFSRITKMQEALSAVRKQLDTSILHGRRYENLNLQAEMLERIKQALETLRPKVKKTMSDIDMVSGALSMEYFDKLTALGERLRRDWKEINEDYGSREQTRRECSSELASFSQRAEALSASITAHEQTIGRWKQVSLVGHSHQLSY